MKYIAKIPTTAIKSRTAINAIVSLLIAALLGVMFFPTNNPTIFATVELVVFVCGNVSVASLAFPQFAVGLVVPLLFITHCCSPVVLLMALSTH